MKTALRIQSENRPLQKAGLQVRAHTMASLSLCVDAELSEEEA